MMNKTLIFIEKNNQMTGEKKNIIYNGILLNKKVCLTDDIDLCNYIFMSFRDYNIAKNYKDEYLKKLIVIDFRDNAKDIFDIKCLKYFKRSIVNKNNLSIINYNRKIIPISYCLKNETLKFKRIFSYKRNIDISIFFNPNNSDYRNLLAKFIKYNFSNYNIHVGICGNKGKIGRNSIQNTYYKKMFHSKIVITCNPSQWEGDYRTWEALSSGSLVFVDKMITPIKHPLINKKHVIFYNKKNLRNLKKKILFYLKRKKLREKIAKKGNKYALNFHKTSDRINEILSYLD